MSALAKIRKAFLKKDPAGLAPDEIELYNQMKEAGGITPKQSRKREKEKKKQARKEESMGMKGEKRVERRERGIQQQRERHQTRRDRLRRVTRNSATPTTSIPSFSSTTTPTPTPTPTPLTLVSTTPPSSPPPPYSLIPLTPAAEPPQPPSHPIPPTTTTTSHPACAPPLPFCLNTPDETWRYLAWTLAWTLEQGARGRNGMYWMADEEYLEGEIAMDPRW